MNYYKLDNAGEHPVECTAREFAYWFENANRKVAETIVGPSRISTVFLGIDNNFFGSGPPILWETLVFEGDLDGEMQRCGGSKAEAGSMHDEMVRRVREYYINSVKDIVVPHNEQATHPYINCNTSIRKIER